MSTFLKLHHGFLEHEKHAELTNAALLLHISGLMHASERLTDGRLPKAMTVRLQWSARLVAEGSNVDALIGELIRAGVWEDHAKHYSIVKYLDHNNSRAQVDAIRVSDRERKAKQREREKLAKSNPEQIQRQRQGIRRESLPESQGESRRDSGALADVLEMPDPAAIVDPADALAKARNR